MLLRALPAVAVLILAVTAYSPDVPATPRSRILELLARPVGRFLVHETREGADLARFLIGRPVANNRDFFELLYRLEGYRSPVTGWNNVGRSFEERVLSIESDLQAALRTSPGRKADEVVAALVRERLALRSHPVALPEGSVTEVHFPPLGADYYASVRASFIDGAAPGATSRLAARDALAAYRQGKSLAGQGLQWMDLTRLPRSLWKTLPGVDLRFADAIGFQAPGAVLDRGLFEWATLNQAGFRGTSLRGARLRGADLRLSDLRGAKLDGADLTDARLQDAWIDADTVLPFGVDEALARGMTFDPPFRLR